MRRIEESYNNIETVEDINEAFMNEDVVVSINSGEYSVKVEGILVASSDKAIRVRCKGKDFGITIWENSIRDIQDLSKINLDKVRLNMKNNTAIRIQVIQ